MSIGIMKGTPQTSMGRRLLSMAAPIVGGALGGPAGAAIGQVIGGKLGGESSQDALMSGAGSLASAKMQGAQPAKDTSYGRRINTLSQDPKLALADGINALSTLPAGHPLKKELAPTLVRAQMMA